MTVPSPEPAGAARPFHGWARLAGHYRWLEGRLFEVLGGWVPTVPEAEVKLCLRAQSFHHAWHSELWQSLIPAVPGVDCDDATAPMGEGWLTLVDAVSAARAPEQTIEKLAGVYRVLVPRMVSAYTAVLEARRHPGDMPVERPVRLILRDELDDWRQGEMLLQGLLHTPHDVERAARQQHRLELLAVQAVGLDGPGDVLPTGLPEP